MSNDNDEKRGAGRPRIGERLTAIVPVELIAELDKRADEAGKPRSEFVRETLEASVSPEADALRLLAAALRNRKC